MRITAESDLTLSRRMVRLVALSCAILLAACQDVTAPDEVAAANVSLRLSQSSVSDELGELGASLDDITGWSLVSLTDPQGLASIAGILNGLKGHLASGRIDACQQDVNDARSFLGSRTLNEQVELGGVGVTLDVIQSVLDKASQ